jgi:hypothetical protein
MTASDPPSNPPSNPYENLGVRRRINAAGGPVAIIGRV